MPRAFLVKKVTQEKESDIVKSDSELDDSVDSDINVMDTSGKLLSL